MATSKTKRNEWFFRQKPTGDAKSGGVNNFSLPSTIDTFVREVVQNINDQRVGNVVSADFFLTDLTGKNLSELLDLIGWDRGLKTHLEAVAGSPNHLGQSVTRALESVKKGKVRALVVTDSSAWGLEGDEEDGSNFSMLCRDQLVTDNSMKTVGGGSYGLGKSVLWAFSEASTVLFSSQPLDRASREKLEPFRFFGRSYLPSHKIGHVWHQPDGFFGDLIPGNPYEWVSSVRGTGAKQLVAQTLLQRTVKGTGTTILIPFFGIPTKDETPTLKSLQSQISGAVQKWFWPALDAGTLKVSVQIEDQPKLLIKSPDWAKPFRRALNAKSPEQKLESEGEVAQIPISVNLPSSKIKKDSKESLAVAKLSVTRISAEESEGLPEDISRTVALVRGALMVVQYSSKGLPLLGADFLGVVQAGLYSGNSKSDELLEQLLRDSEPPAHDKWDPNSQKLVDNYRAGGKAVAEFTAQIGQAISKLLTTKNTSSEAPKKLAELLGGKKKSVKSASRTERFQMLGGATIDRSNPKRITASMTLQRNSGNGAWSALVSVVLLDEVGGKDALTIDPASLVVEADGNLTWSIEKRGSRWRVDIPQGCTTVKLSCTAEVGDSKISRMAMATARVVYQDRKGSK